MIAKKTCHCWINQRVESLSKEKNLLLLKMVNETFEAFSCSLLVLTTAVVLLDTSPITVHRCSYLQQQVILILTRTNLTDFQSDFSHLTPADLVVRILFENRFLDFCFL